MFFVRLSALCGIAINAIIVIERTVLEKLGNVDILRCLEPSPILVKETDNNTPLSYKAGG